MRYHTFFHNRFRRGLSLMELIVVLVILGAITAFALPRYNQSVNITKERRALNNLYLIYAAQSSYFAQNNVWWPPNGPVYTLAQINTTLMLNILADGDTYTCRFTSGVGGYTCRVVFQNGAFGLKVTEAALGALNPCCEVGPCPLTAACP